MKHLEAIITIIMFMAIMLLTIYYFETNCGGDRFTPFYTDCSNNLLFHPKIIVIPYLDPLDSELRILNWILYQVCSNEVKSLKGYNIK
jgi:hypothetical protein